MLDDHLDQEHHREMVIAANVVCFMFVLSYSGHTIKGHAHKFDHITQLAPFGKVIFRANGKEEVFEGPHIFITPCGIVHEFECVGDMAVLTCTHAIRNGDGENDIAPQDITTEQALDLLNRFPLTLED